MTLETSHISILHIPAHHPSLAGHFPGMPLLPGVVLLDKALNHIAKNFTLNTCRLDNVKFLHPVIPDEVEGIHLTLKYTQNHKGTIHFSIMDAEHIFVSGIIHA